MMEMSPGFIRNLEIEAAAHARHGAAAGLWPFLEKLHEIEEQAEQIAVTIRELRELIEANH